MHYLHTHSASPPHTLIFLYCFCGHKMPWSGFLRTLSVPPIRKRHARQPTVTSLGYWQLLNHHKRCFSPEPPCLKLQPHPRAHTTGGHPEGLTPNLHLLSHSLLIPDPVILVSPLTFCFGNCIYSGCWPPPKAAENQNL